MKMQSAMAGRGSDPSAVMKGDHPQLVQGSTAPSSPVNRPKPVGGQYSLPRTKRKTPKKAPANC
jgi:hypothetical protein